MAGGYAVKRSVYNLRFADSEFEGMKIKVKAMPIADMIEMSEDFNGDLVFNGQLTPTMATDSARLFEWFLEYAIEWNLQEEDGTPIPLDVHGLNSLELPFVLKIVTTWLSATAGVADDLKGDSPSGLPYPEESLPMEVSSPSPAS